MGFWEQLPKQRVIAAHRGYRACYPENTMAAFEASVGRCDLLELDVGFSSDGVPVIIHDDTLERTSDVATLEGFMPPYNVVDYSYAALLRLDLSSWFLVDDPFGTIASGEADIALLESLPPQRIPTLKEVLSFCREAQLPVNVELKDMRGTPFDDTAMQRILSVIREQRMEGQVLLSSFNHNYIVQARKLAPKISRAALQEHAHPPDLLTYLRELEVDCYHADREIMTEALVRTLHDAGITTNLFTVNDPQEKERLFGWGVKSLFTDFL